MAMQITEALPDQLVCDPLELDGLGADAVKPLEDAEISQAVEIDELSLVRNAILLVGSNGDNAAHLATAFGNLRGEDGRPRHEVHAVDIKPESEAKVPYDYFYQVAPNGSEELEGDERLEELIHSGKIHAVYLSLVPKLHLSEITKYLDYVKEGLIDFVVVPKPAVSSTDEMRQVDTKIKDIKEHRRRTIPDYDPDEDEFLFVHEHYVEKGPWDALSRELTEVTHRLGRLRNVVFNISESRTVEEENRIPAFTGGAFEDFFPHVASLGLGVQLAINETDRFYIPDHDPDQKIEVETARYELDGDAGLTENGEKLPPGVDTGFKIAIKTKIYDKVDGTEHDLKIKWVAGKGLNEHRKEALLEFEGIGSDGEPVRSIVKVDFLNNTLTVPKSVADLFPGAEPDDGTGKYVAQYEDNGYKHSVECGLNGRDPRDYFQSWKQARIITKWHKFMERYKPEVPTKYSRGDVPLFLWM
jgi:hypothetical protein